MAHVRAQIRDAVATALTGLGATVIKSRFFPNDESALPVFLVYTVSENIDMSRSSAPTTVFRVLSLTVDASAADDEQTLDDTLDDFAVSIETALAGNRFGGLALYTDLASTEINTSTEGRQPLGTARLTFEILYRTSNTNPETAV
jgi:hypothetical protein